MILLEGKPFELDGQVRLIDLNELTSFEPTYIL